MKFYQGSYFPTNFTYLGYLGLPSSVVIYFVGNPFFALLIVLLSFAFAFTKIGISINPATKSIQEFTDFLGIKWGKYERYKELKTLRLKEEQFYQTLNSRGSTTTIEYTLYNAYLITDNESILLMGDKNKEKIVTKMEKVSKLLAIPFEVQ